MVTHNDIYKPDVYIYEMCNGYGIIVAWQALVHTIHECLYAICTLSITHIYLLVIYNENRTLLRCDREL